ncbi:sensor domain-containing diguanylate cyclase [Carboxydothermus hydrogenoformans]|uniref:GGDEF domain protein n=1 Tax=Carboxydothermus hydrogenoformans (strain ATCC BAA-161 / DSM 6008 / Z-2901) TaxID=246194 RepID=Q3A9C3_CARHZ|nr:GGDEF domain-containing protein [Carboxydothermus hydrogenoformans]ABB14659.1 GGDEF domain protein [Carboxydothermus hydrogenoformans Z-2901]
MEGYKKKLFLVFAGAFLFLAFARYFTPTMYRIYSHEQYLGIHTFLELITVFVSFAIFSMVWLMREGLTGRSGRFLYVLGSLFFAVGWVDLLHALSYKGMPLFITESSYQKATFLWLYGRFIVAFAVIIASLHLWGSTRAVVRPWFIVFTDIVLIVIAFLFSTVYLKYVPPLFIEGQGLTSLKVSLEHLLMTLYGLGFLLVFAKRQELKLSLITNLGYFLIFTFFSEAAFTFYKSVYDTYNLIGHLYKVLAYIFLFRAIYLSGIITYFYNLSEMAKMSEELLKHQIDLEAILKIHGDKLQQLIPKAERIAIYLKEGEHTYRAGYSSGKFQEMFPERGMIYFKDLEKVFGLSVEVFENLNNVLEMLHHKEFTPLIKEIFAHSKQVLYIPLVTDGELYGFILAYIFRPFVKFDEDDFDTAHFFQKFATLAIVQAKRQEIMERLSYEDSLTGLHNRRYFFEELNKTKYDADRYGEPFTVVFLDMNGLKEINDNLGHQAGDLALKLIGQKIRENIRQSDVGARLGGDEFGIIYRKMGLEEGKKKIAELKKNFSALKIKKYQREFSLAVGGATYPVEAGSLEILLKLADDRMYEDKGKNRRSIEVGKRIKYK